MANASAYFEKLPGAPTDFATHAEVADAEATAENNAAIDAQNRVDALAATLSMQGWDVSPLYEMDFNGAGGQLTTLGGSVVIPEFDVWAGPTIPVHYVYSLNGCIVWPGGWSYDHPSQTMFMSLISGKLQTVQAIVYLFLLGRP